ncbi:uncharacterized protein [Watersipora subatra]|uniref:uncharacterized protein n=1 Tax=Watersipora subatra TaxID=2589382 RepID=UPI00355B9078
MIFYIRGKKRTLHSSDQWCAHSVKRTQLQHNNTLNRLAKEQNAAEKKLNKDIKLFSEEQRSVLPLIQARSCVRAKVRVYIREDLETRRRSILLTVHRKSQIEQPAEQLGGRRRSVTVSDPTKAEYIKDMRECRVRSALREPLALDITMDKELVAALMTKKSLPGLTSNYDYEDNIEDDMIPACVLKRGRRMSRSATCMNDLVRQELSDYVDKKQQPLPTLATSSLSIKGKLSYGLDKPVIKTLTTTQSQDESTTGSSHRSSLELSSKSPSPNPSETEYRVRTSSLPCPPTAPKPSTIRLNRRVIRHQRSAIKPTLQ